MYLPVFLILLVGFLLRIFLSVFGTLELDVNTFIVWAGRLNEVGFTNFYDSWSDYLPGYLYILKFLGGVNSSWGIPKEVLFKFPGILADILTGWLIFEIVKKLKNRKAGLIATSLYIFNPAILANSTLWGQIDSLTSFLSLAVIWLLSINPYLSAAVFSLGVLVKPQAIFIAPVIFLMLFKKKVSFRKYFSYGVVFLSVFLTGFIPFNSSTNLISFILGRLSLSANQYPFTSVNAFNFWGLFGFWKNDNTLFFAIGTLLSFGLPLLFMRKLKDKKGWEYISLTFSFLTSFLFFTRMHERHLLPIFAPLAISASSTPFFWLPYFVLSATYTLNLYFSFIWITRDFAEAFSSSFIELLVIINLMTAGLFVWISLSKKTFGEFIGRFKSFKLKRATRKLILPEIKLDKNIKKVFLISILVFAFFSRIFALGSPPKEYFDEVYHAFTAKRVLAGDPKAWEWWNTPPEGFAYEWTHPPFAKLAMAGGMKIFGENAFGWRIPGALLGVLSVYLVYLIAKEITKGIAKDSDITGILAAGIFSLDGLFLVMSRIGMNDIYMLTFGLLALYLFLKERQFLSAFSFGLAISSKWSAIYFLPIFALAHFVFRKKAKAIYLWFIAIPLIVYLLTYLPMFLTGHNLDTFIGVQKQMWWYHTRLKAVHAYTSPWWTWPLTLRPVYLYTSEEVGNMVSRIYAIGNPAVFWGGALSIFSIAYLAVKRKIKILGFIVFSYLVLFTLWAVSPRIMFLYHYLPALPFLSIALAIVLRRHIKIIPWFFVASFILFIYFFPHWVGLNIPLWLDRSYYLFPSWR
ncbi:glycosyltransferase family 39 protein [Patescibacteria group bacterium]|nr:glycosyltransferase family 39 protein [Patescibacteria group bacterium]